MEKLIDLDHLLNNERPNLKELIILTKSDACNMDLAVLNRDMYKVLKVIPFGVDEWSIEAYDRTRDGSFKGFSYLELSNVETLGNTYFEKCNSVPSRTAVAHYIDLLTKVGLNSNMITSTVNHLSLAVKNTYNLLDNCVVVIPVFKTED